MTQHGAFLPLGGRKRRRRVLLAEDDGDFRILLASALRREGYEVEEVSDGLSLSKALYAILVYRTGPLPDILVTDDKMPGTSGMQVLAMLRGRGSPLPVVLITAFADEDTHRAATLMGATLLDKPFDLAELCEVVREKLEAG